jgi:hypothetical protein
MTTLPHMPRRRWGPRDFPSWLVNFLDARHPDWRHERLDRDEVLADITASVPRGVVPKGDDLQDGWVVRQARSVLKLHGIAYIDTDDGATRELGAQLELPLADFRDDVIDDLRRATADVAAVTRRVERYAAAHPARIPDSLAFVANCRHAAGL